MSAHVCGCDPDHHTGAWRCADYPRCAYGRTLQETPMPIPAALLALIEGLVLKHGEEVAHHIVTKVLDHPELVTNPPTVIVQTPDMNENVATAWKLTHGDRRSAYGTPAEVFAGYAKIWSGLIAGKLKADLTAVDVTLMMTGLKLAREANSPGKDNVVDAHGYLILRDEV